MLTYNVHCMQGGERCFVCTVISKTELDFHLAHNPSLQGREIVIVNSEGEYCDKELKPIVHPTTSMKSMVELLKDKFGKK